MNTTKPDCETEILQPREPSQAFIRLRPLLVEAERRGDDARVRQLLQQLQYATGDPHVGEIKQQKINLPKVPNMSEKHAIYLATFHDAGDPSGKNRQAAERLKQLAKCAAGHGFAFVAVIDGRQVDIVPRRTAKAIPSKSVN